MAGTLSRLKTKLRTGDTLERCGLVQRSGRIVEIENTHPNPEKGFVIPAREMIRLEKSVIATWHTHPVGPAFLSEEDYNGFRQWPELRHYVVSPSGVTAYEVVDGLVLEVDLAAD